MYKQSKDTNNINYDRPKMELRSSSKVKLKQKFTAITKVYLSPLYRGWRLWDKLPICLQNQQDFNVFKNEIKKLDQ